jgi:hypothetical protein
MIVRLNFSKATLTTSVVVLTLLSSLAVVPTCARADSIQEFVMPSSGYLSIQFIGGEAGGVTTFGLGTSPSNFIALFSGLPNTPSSLAAVNVGFFSAGTTIHMGMFTTFAGESGWAFSNRTDQASIVAFSDIDNSLGLGGSIIQQTSPNTWVLHLDDALSYKYDDDDNDVLIRLRITSKPVSTVPEPASGLFLLSGSALVAWRARRRRNSPSLKSEPRRPSSTA